jgi:polysaccharide export outer membrane protein
MAQLPNFQPPPAPRTQNVPNVNRAPTETAYTLGGGDRIRLDIFDVPEYSGEYQVLVDGTLNLPIVGSVEVEGLTIRQATDKISNLYARFVKRPVLTVSLLLPRPVKLSVAGEVTRPGSYTVPLTEGRTFPTVTQALQLAGGITQVANVRSVQIRRRGAPGRQQQFSVDLFDLLRNGDLSQDILCEMAIQFLSPQPQLSIAPKTVY